MRKPIIGGMLVLIAMTSLATWAQELVQVPPNRKLLPAEANPLAKDASNPTKAASQTAATKSTPQQENRPLGPRAATAEDVAREGAIRSEAEKLIAAFNSKKSKGFAEMFVPNAEYELDTGEVIMGRAAIEEYYANTFDKYPNAKARFKESRIRLITPHMAIEEGNLGVAHVLGEIESETVIATIWTFSDGKWHIASMRELTAATETEPAHARLEQLAWLIGDWIDESHESLVKTTCRWSDDKNFLLQDFTVHVRGESVLSATQRIGWDPLTHKIRGWFFDSHGGFGESYWNWNGDKWVIRTSAVREDGVIAASLDFLTPLSSDSYRWQSSHRMAGDESLSDWSVVVVRKAPSPETAKAEQNANRLNDANPGAKK